MADTEEKQPEWIRIQQKTFTRWFNTQLKERILKIENLQTDLSDGTMLIILLEIISSKSLGRYNKTPKIKPQKYENIGIALKFLQTEGIKLVNIGPEDIESGKLKLILGLIWTIILRYQIHIEEGKSARNDLLNWVRQQIPEYDIKNFNKDWSDGRAICALVNSLKNGLCPGHWDLDPEKALENATLGMDLAQNELEIPEVLDPADLINPDVDELSMMTYLSYFRDYLENLKKRMAADELEKLSVAGKCKAYGPGLEGGYAGHPTDFTIEAINTNGRRVNHGGDPFKVDINGPSGAIESQITDNDDGTYKVVYTPGAVGEHTVAVTLNDAPIEKSPFKVKIIRANPNAKNSKAYGPGLEAVTVGEDAPFTIESFDDRGLPVNEGGDKYDVKVTGPQGDVPVNMTDNKDGKYSVDYLPEDVGKHTVTVQLKGEHLPGSPFTAEATLAESAANPNTTVAYGPGLEGGKTSFPSVFTIEVKDAQGNRVPSGDKVQPVGVDIKDAAGKEVACDIVDHKDGTHTATYNPENPGTYKVGVVLRHKKNRAADAHIKDSPFTVEVGTGANAEKSTAFGPGVEGGVNDQEPAKFTVQTKDNKGKNMSEGGAPVEVKVTGPNGEEVPATLKDNGDGTYSGEYNPEEPGHYQVAVNIGPNPLAKSPFDVTVDAAGDAEKCEAYGPGLEAGNDDHHPAKFTVKSVDKRGNPVKEGGEPFKVKVTGPNGEDVPATLKDNGDGTYDAEYKPEEAGKYKVDVTLRDEPVAKSPYNVEVAAVGDLSKSEVFGPGIESGNDDQHPAEFKVVLKDKNGEPIKNGGEPVKVKVTGPHGEVPSTIKDNGDGTYDAEYKPTDAGKHVVEVTLRDEPLAKSPYNVDIAVVGDLSKSEAFGPGLEAGNDDQHPAQFKVVLKDKNGEPIKNGGEPVKVKVTGPNGDVPATVKDNGDGTYDAEYQPTDAGDHTVEVTLRDEPLAKSPYHVNVGLVGDLANTEVFGPGLEAGNDDQHDAHFTIVAKDKSGEQIKNGGEAFKVDVHGPNGAVPSSVKDNGDGTYAATYTPQNAGDHKIEVTLRGEPVAKSPYHVTIKAGADPSKSIAFGNGVDGKGVDDQNPAEFRVQTKDKDGNNLHYGGEPVNAKVTGPNGNDVPCKVKDNGDGTYDAEYQVPKGEAGEYKVDVNIGDKPIAGSPFNVEVEEGIDEEESEVEDYSFVIQAKNAKGEKLTRGGGAFKVSVKGPEGEPIESESRDLGDGTYLVSYKMAAPGEYVVTVRVNGRIMKQFPTGIRSSY